MTEQDDQFEQPEQEGSGSNIEEEVTIIGGTGNVPSIADTESEATNQFNCPSLGIHPALTCDSFYVCTRVGIGGATLQSCGSGLHFDSRLQACNWPVEAKCTHSLAAAKFYTDAMYVIIVIDMLYAILW